MRDTVVKIIGIVRSRLNSSYSADVLYIACGAVLSFVYAFGFKFDFFEPNALYHDRLMGFSFIRTLIDGEFFRNSSLGFPAGLNTLIFPYSDFSQRFIVYILAKISSDVFLINNMFFIIIIVLCFILSYLCFYKFTQDRFNSFIGSLLFVFVPYLKIRSLEHDFLAAFYCVPIAFYLFYKIDQQKASLKSDDINAFFKNGLILSAILIIAISGIYYTAFAIGFLLFTGVVNSYLKSATSPFRLSFYVSALIINILFLFELPTIIEMYQLAVTTPMRAVTDQQLYGVRFSDLIWTASFYWESVSFSQYRAIRGPFEGYDFWPGLPLSLIAILMLFAIPLSFQKRSSAYSPLSEESHRRRRIILIMVYFALAVLIFAGVDGLGYIFNYYIISAFRSQNRLSPFFSFAVILILLLLAENMRKVYRGRLLFGVRADNVLRLSLIGLFGLNSFPFFGFLGEHQRSLLTSPQYIADMTSLKSLNQALERNNVRHVLQSPVLAWPEAAPKEDFMAYDHFLPYIFSAYPGKIKWSYGLSRDQIELGMLRGLDRHPDRLWALKRISCLGFDSILIEKRAFGSYNIFETEAAAEKLKMRVLFDDELRRAYAFEKFEGHQCELNEQFGKWISSAVDDLADPYLIKGWKKAENSMRWSSDEVLTISLPLLPDNLDDLKMSVMAKMHLPANIQSRTVLVFYNKKQIGTWRFSQSNEATKQEVVIPIDHNLTPFRQYLELHVDNIKDESGGNVGQRSRVMRNDGIGVERIRFDKVETQ